MDMNDSYVMSHFTEAKAASDYDMFVYCGRLQEIMADWTIGEMCHFVRLLQDRRMRREEPNGFGDLAACVVGIINTKTEASLKGHRKPRVDPTENDARRPWEQPALDFALNALLMADTDREYEHECWCLGQMNGRGRRTDHTDMAGMYPVFDKAWKIASRYSKTEYEPTIYRQCRRGLPFTYAERRLLMQALNPARDGQIMRKDKATVDTMGKMLCRDSSEICAWWDGAGFRGLLGRKPPQDSSKVIGFGG